MVLVKDRGGWGFPRGKGRESESEQQSAIREVQEEIGVGMLSILYYKIPLFNYV